MREEKKERLKRRDKEERVIRYKRRRRQQKVGEKRIGGKLSRLRRQMEKHIPKIIQKEEIVKRKRGGGLGK